MLALIGVGCSNAPTETDTGSTAKNTSGRDKGVTFSQCMRDHGVKEFPDPEGSDELTIDGVLNGSSLDPDSAAFKQAIAACRDSQPAGFTGGGKRTPERQSAALKFAQCIREHGVTDFPDPVNGQPLVDTNRIPSANRAGGMDVLNAAMRTCGELAEKAIKDRK